MSEETKKVDPIEQEAGAAAELSEQDLDSVAGGTAGEPIDGVGVGLGKRPNPGSIA